MDYYLDKDKKEQWAVILFPLEDPEDKYVAAYCDSEYTAKEALHTYLAIANKNGMLSTFGFTKKVE